MAALSMGGGGAARGWERPADAKLEREPTAHVIHDPAPSVNVWGVAAPAPHHGPICHWLHRPQCQDIKRPTRRRERSNALVEREMAGLTCLQAAPLVST